MRELEFLPEDYIRARFQRRIGFLRSWLLLALGLAMGLWSLQMGFWVRDARAELTALRGAGSAVDADVEKVRVLRAETQTYNRRLDLLRTLRPPVAATEVLAAVAARVPEGMTLTALSLEYPQDRDRRPPTVRLSGLARAETVVTQALGDLEAAPQFGQAVLVESRPVRAESEWRAFVIDLAVRPDPPGKES